jgi:hypothetical protein
MLKKVLQNIIIIFSILFLFQSTVFAANENATDIVLESEVFCPNYPSEFTLYNETQYADKKKIEDDLCGVNEKPSEDRCEVWEEFTGTIVVHNGPIDGTAILKEFKLKNQRDFTVTFPSVNDYLIIYESGQDKYTNWEKTITLPECKYSTNKKDTTENTTKEIKKTNQTFLYDNNEFVIELEDTTYIKQNEIKFEIILNNELNNSIKTFEIKSENETKTFSKMKIQINTEITGKKIEIFKLDEISNTWKKVNLKNIEENENSLEFEITTFGKYSIVEKNEEVKIINNNSTTDKEIRTNTQEDAKVQSPISLDLNKTKSKLSQISPGIIIGVVIFVLAIVGFLFIPKQRKKNDISKYQTEAPINEETYKKTKEYVQKYKAQFNQEQIRISLNTAEIDINIINKVLKEEFTQ